MLTSAATLQREYASLSVTFSSFAIKSIILSVAFLAAAVRSSSNPRVMK
jgi:hypothetical protein